MLKKILFLIVIVALLMAVLVQTGVLKLDRLNFEEE